MLKYCACEVCTKANQDYNRQYWLKRRYNLTPEDVDRMIEDQGGACAWCQRVTDLVVDHNHTTGEVRGMLCTFCNRTLGGLYVDDNLDMLDRIRDYLT